MRKALVTAAVFLAVASPLAASRSRHGPPKRNTYPIAHVSLPGEGRGDYITTDIVSRRLYVSHSAVVHVLNLDTLRPLAQIGGIGKAHGIAVAPETGHGFISDGKDNAVVMFDLASNKTIKSIKAGQNPDSIVYDPASKMVFVFNGTSQDVSVIDPALGEIIRTIPLGDKPEFSVSDGKGRVWANLEDSAAIVALDTRSMMVAATWQMADCEGPAGLAFDPQTRRLFSGCGNKSLKIVNADTGAIVAAVPIGEDADGVAYDAAGKRVFVTNRDGTMTIVRQLSADRYIVERNLRTELYAKTVAFDPQTRRLFSSTADLIWHDARPGTTEKPLPDAKSGTFRLLVISPK